jgi:hypothetical protein
LRVDGMDVIPGAEERGSFADIATGLIPRLARHPV